MKPVLFAPILVLIATMAMAQAVPQSHFAGTPANQNSAMPSRNAATQSSDLRGCLSGSKGNYTLTDHHGNQYKVVGDSHRLWDEVGHEVDLSGTTQGSNTFQESQITDIAARCWNFKLN